MGWALKGNVAPGWKHDIGAPPWVVADQLPAMAGTRVIFGEQNVAGADDEGSSRACLEFQRTAEGDDETRNRILMPFKRAARIRLLKGDIDRAGGETQNYPPARPRGGRWPLPRNGNRRHFRSKCERSVSCAFSSDILIRCRKPKFRCGEPNYDTINKSAYEIFGHDIQIV